MFKRSITAMASILLASQAMGQWSNNTSDGYSGSTVKGVQIGDNLGDKIGGRSRVTVVDTLPGDHDDSVSIFQIGVESRVRDLSDTLSAGGTLPRFGFGATFDACKSKAATSGQTGTAGNTLLQNSGFSIGAQSRALMLCDVWTDGAYPANPPDIYQYGLGSSTSFTDPKGGYIRTGWVKNFTPGSFAVQGDNHHFWDDTATYSKYSIHQAVGLDVSYSSGNFVGKGTDPTASSANPDSSSYAGTFRFGSHVGSFDGIKVYSELKADYDASAGSYNGTYDKVDEWTGVRVKAPTKKIAASTTSASDQQTIADKSFSTATGVFIEAPSATAAGSSGPNVSPSNYVGLKVAAKSEFSEDVKITDVLILPPRTAPSSPVDGTVYLDSSTGKLNFYYSGSWRAITSTP